MWWRLTTLLFLTPCLVDAKTIWVRPDGGGDLPTIQDAIDAAADGDTVLLAPGTYRGPGNRALTLPDRSITLTSQAGASQTVIDCENTRGFSTPIDQQSDFEVSHLTFRNAAGTYYAFILNGGSPTIRGNVFANCQAMDGGILRVIVASPRIMDNSFEYNNAPAVIHTLLATSRIEGNRFRWNKIAIAAESSGGTIQENVFENNEAALYLNHSSPDVIGNLLVVNSYGVEIVDSSPLLSFNTMYGQRAFSIDVRGLSAPSIFFSIITRTEEGAAIRCEAQTSSSLYCSLLFENRVSDGFCGVSSDLIQADPVFCDPASGDFGLATSSPAAASNNPCAQRIGALPVSCQAVSTTPTTWSHVKQIYRESR